MKKNSKKILITGGAGYIGLNLTSFFLKEKYQIYVVDNLSTSRSINKNIKKLINFKKIDLTKDNKVKEFFRNKTFDLVIHLAAFSGVKEFNKNVSKSFKNNVLSTKNLLRFAFKKQKTKLIFASSAAVYGKVSGGKVSENKSLHPANHYGISKYVCEQIINEHFRNKKNHYAILRYFNVVGSIINFKIKKKINSLFDIIGNNIKKNKYKININGSKLDTKDGTPERDFIHILDLCRMHVKVYEHLRKNRKTILNCGSGQKYSVLQIVKTFEKLKNKKFKISYKVVNPDETQTICSDNKNLKKVLKIEIKRNKIYSIIRDYL